MHNRLRMLLRRDGFAPDVGPGPDPEPTLLVKPSALWNGAAGSGWSSGNEEPQPSPSISVVSAACRNMFPHRERINPVDGWTIGCDGDANGMLAYVELNLEGAKYRAVEEVLRPRTTRAGATVFNIGRFFDVDVAACLAQHASINTMKYYLTAVPNNPAIQPWTAGPFYLYPEAQQFDKRLEIRPSLALPQAGVAYRSIGEAQVYVRGQGSVHTTELVLMENGVYPMAPQTNGTSTRRGRMRIRCAEGVTATIGGTEAITNANAQFDLKSQGIHFMGPGLTIDWAWVRFIGEPYTATGITQADHWVDGVPQINSRGSNATVFGTVGEGVRGNRYLMDVEFKDVFVTIAAAASALNCTLNGCPNDEASNAGCVQGCVGWDNDSELLKQVIPALKVTYDGAGAATIRKQGTGTSPNRDNVTSVIYLSDPAGTATYQTQNLLNHSWGTAGSIKHFADFVNARAGWHCEILVEHLSAGDRRMAAQSAMGYPRGGDFPALAVNSTTGVTLGGAYEIHPDWYQLNSTGATGNKIMRNNRFSTTAVQFIFLSDMQSCWNFILRDNAFHAAPADEAYYSQIDATFRHLVMEGNTFANQGFRIRNTQSNVPPTTFDATCSFSANVFAGISTLEAPNLANLVMADNHAMSISSDLAAIATGTTTGGSMGTLLADAAAGDFTPIGTLATTLVPRRSRWDVNFDERAANDAKGAVRVPV